MEEAGEDFMECPEFAAGVYAPGIGQGWEELINVELEITLLSGASALFQI